MLSPLPKLALLGAVQRKPAFIVERRKGVVGAEKAAAPGAAFALALVGFADQRKQLRRNSIKAHRSRGEGKFFAERMRLAPADMLQKSRQVFQHIKTAYANAQFQPGLGENAALAAAVGNG